MDHHPVLAGGVGHRVQGHPGLDVAVVLVEPGHPLQVGGQGVLVESPLAEPGDDLEHRPPAPALGLHGLGDSLVLEGLVAVELDALDPDLAAFADQKAHRILIPGLDQGVAHHHVDIALIQVAVADPVAGAGHRPLVEEGAGPHLDAVQYLLGLDLGVAQHLHPGHGRQLGHHDSDRHPVLGAVGPGRDVAEIAKGVHPLDRLCY